MTARLFLPYMLGDLKLANRIVMAPLTRNRANLDGDTPSELHVDYYSQRAGAGLIISEGCQISPEGKGYYRTPGIYSEAQVVAWKKVTDAVHAKGGRIFCQLWHVGRISHTLFQPGGVAPVAPSAIRADAQTFSPQGMVDVSTPRALHLEEIIHLVGDYKRAARCAQQAGFDGVEVHAANGYLIDQFLRESSNKRNDRYGGSIENRVRLFQEVIAAITEVWPSNRVGFRISPFSHAGGAIIDEPLPTYQHVIDVASEADLAYMHMVEGETGGERSMRSSDIKSLRDAFKNAYMANNGYDRDMAIRAVNSGSHLVCFGRFFIANPDLPERLLRDESLATPDQNTFYGGGAKGYTDYPFSTRSRSAA